MAKYILFSFLVTNPTNVNINPVRTTQVMENTANNIKG
jgi:hypothetical protein